MGQNEDRGGWRAALEGVHAFRLGGMEALDPGGLTLKPSGGVGGVLNPEEGEAAEAAGLEVARRRSVTPSSEVAEVLGDPDFQRPGRLSHVELGALSAGDDVDDT